MLIDPSLAKTAPIDDTIVCLHYEHLDMNHVSILHYNLISRFKTDFIMTGFELMHVKTNYMQVLINFNNFIIQHLLTIH